MANVAGLGLRNGPTPLTQAQDNLSKSCAECVGTVGGLLAPPPQDGILSSLGIWGENREGGGGTGPAKIYGVE